MNGSWLVACLPLKDTLELTQLVPLRRYRRLGRLYPIGRPIT